MKTLILIAVAALLTSCADYAPWFPDVPVSYRDPNTGIIVRGIVGDGKFEPAIDLTEINWAK